MKKPDNFFPELVVFDMDQTLCESKVPIDGEMTDLLKELLRRTKVAVVSGANFERFQIQLIIPIGQDEVILNNLFIFATSGGSFFRFTQNKFGATWEAVYERLLSAPDKQRIMTAFKNALEASAFKKPEKVYGEQFEEKGCQITFSALGQEAPIAEKKLWDPEAKIRQKIVSVLETLLPDFNIMIGGSTSIDVTPKDIDKSYAISQIEKNLGIAVSEMLFVGDRLLPGGNDHSVIKTGVKTWEATDIQDIKLFIREYLNRLDLRGKKA